MVQPYSLQQERKKTLGPDSAWWTSSLPYDLKYAKKWQMHWSHLSALTYMITGIPSI